MNPSFTSFLLVFLVEAVYAVVMYLKERLHRHMQDRDGSSTDFFHQDSAEQYNYPR